MEKATRTSTSQTTRHLGIGQPPETLELLMATPTSSSTTTVDSSCMTDLATRLPCALPNLTRRRFRRFARWRSLRPVQKLRVAGKCRATWMNKHDGTYYLQFAAPGTQFKTYGDGVLTSKDPMGPFTYAPYSPFSFKP